ncbi:hypothetical protein MRX96_038567 [Rhipicephalus microplus]
MQARSHEEHLEVNAERSFNVERSSPGTKTLLRRIASFAEHKSTRPNRTHASCVEHSKNDFCIHIRSTARTRTTNVAFE